MTTSEQDSKAGAGESTSNVELVKKALAIGLELHELLAQAASGIGGIRLRLAKAHVLSALDVLTGMTHHSLPHDGSGRLEDARVSSSTGEVD